MTTQTTQQPPANAPPKPSQSPLPAVRKQRAPKQQQWLSVVQVAREYKLSRQTVYNLCENGKLPYYTVPNGRRRFRRSEIEPVLAPYRTPVRNPHALVQDPLGGLEGPVDQFPDA